MTKTKLKFTIFFLFLAGACFLLPQTAKAMEPVYEVLKNTEPSAMGGKIKFIWETLINYVNGLVIVLLIFVAISQILRINVNTYGIKKILPSLILAIIAANFSFLFCRLIVDIGNITMSLFLGGSQEGTEGLVGAFQRISSKSDITAADLDSGANIFWFMIMQFFVIAGAILVLILAYLFLIRNWMIYFLVAVAPIAFMAIVLPQTKSVFTQWISNFAKWVFLPVVSIFWIWMGSLWFQTIEEGNVMLSFVFAAVCFYLAITTPFKMGGAVMTAWGGLGKSAFKNKATGWVANKVKTKWVDPLVDDWKRRAGNWYASTASSSPKIRKKEEQDVLAAMRSGGTPKEVADKIAAIRAKADKDVARKTQWWANPLGSVRRRSLRVAYERDLRKQEEAGWIDQGTREALGGKQGEYLNKDRRYKLGEWAENIATLSGEKDWAEKRLKREYFEGQIATNKEKYKDLAPAAKKEFEDAQASRDERIATRLKEEGKGKKGDERKAIKEKITEEIDADIDTKEIKAKMFGNGFSEAAMNSAQYAMRIRADDQALTNIKNLATAMAHKDDPFFMANKQWADVYEDLALQIRSSKATERTSIKAVSDFEREAQGVPIKMSMEVEGFRLASKNLEKATRLLAEATTDASKKNYSEQIRVANNQMKETREAYKAQIKSILANKRYSANGQLKGIAKATLSDMVLDGSGNIVEDISQVRSLNEIHGIPASIADLFRDRTAKTLSDIVKDETASEKEKRTSVESARMLKDELKKDFKLYIDPKKKGQLSVEKYWKVSAAVSNALSASPTSAEYSEVQQILSAMKIETAKGDEKNGPDIHVRNEIAAANQGSFENFANSNREVQVLIQETTAQFLQRTDKFKEQLKDLKGDELLKEVMKIRKEQTTEEDTALAKLLAESGDFKKDLSEATSGFFSKRFGIPVNQLEQFNEAEMDEQGKVKFKLTGGADPKDKAEYEANLAFLQELERVRFESSIRGDGELLRKGAERVEIRQPMAAAQIRQGGKDRQIGLGLNSRDNDGLYNLEEIKSYLGERYED